VLAEAGDETVAELEVIGVEPNPGASRLSVWVRPWSPEVTAERDEILRALASEAGRLRTAVAESVHRKRAPDLAFELAPWLHGDDEGVGPRADGEGGEP
jgi:ribosome-binding factor A